MMYFSSNYISKLFCLQIDHDQLIQNTAKPTPFMTNDGNISLAATGQGTAVAQVKNKALYIHVYSTRK